VRWMIGFGRDREAETMGTGQRIYIQIFRAARRESYSHQREVHDRVDGDIIMWRSEGGVYQAWYKEGTAATPPAGATVGGGCGE
jgi:hypothetical protein